MTEIDARFKSGLELSREYFFNIAEPILKQDFPDVYPRLAAGLVGNGSECFGYDDEISRDHDWGVDFYIWTSEDDGERIPALSRWKANLLTERPPEFPRARSEYGAHIGVMTCGEFYASLIGAPKGPQSMSEWLRAPEDNLAMSVNGEVFLDNAGEFTKTREYLLNYVPEDLRRKRIAAKCMALAQTGQYNHARTATRDDRVTLRAILARFSDTALAMTFLLNKVYKPYYKWAYRAVRDLPILGEETSRLLLAMADTAGFDDESLDRQRSCITELCAMYANELRTQGLSSADDWFMTAHGEEVHRRITDSFLRSLPTQHEV